MARPRKIKVCEEKEKKSVTKIDFRLIEDFGSLHATQEELADRLDINVRTVQRYMADDESKFSRAYKKGMSKFKEGLRRNQIELANQLNPTMLIWLGKQYLGQSDKVTEIPKGNSPEKSYSDEDLLNYIRSRIEGGK